MTLDIPHDTLEALIADQVGVCTACLSLTHPIPLEASAYQCTACHEPCVVGMHVALRCGVILMMAGEVAVC